MQFAWGSSPLAQTLEIFFNHVPVNWGGGELGEVFFAIALAQLHHNANFLPFLANLHGFLFVIL